MRPRIALVTGANGEMGHLLLPALRERGYELVVVDLQPVAAEHAAQCRATVVGSVVDSALMTALVPRPRARTRCSTWPRSCRPRPRATRTAPTRSTSTRRSTSSASAASRRAPSGRDVRFLFPSSIAVYGLPDAAAKAAAGAVTETEWNRPAGIYGCNKLYGEMIGSYFTDACADGRNAGPRLSSDPVPGLDQRRDASVRRHERLRARDGPRRRPGEAVRVLRRRPRRGCRS